MRAVAQRSGTEPPPNCGGTDHTNGGPAPVKIVLGPHHNSNSFVKVPHNSNRLFALSETNKINQENSRQQQHQPDANRGYCPHLAWRLAWIGLPFDQAKVG